MAINPFEQSLIAMPAAGPMPEKKVPLFSNKLFLQYLAAAGQDIGQGQAIGTNVNAVTQQSITAQSTKDYQMQVLQSMLGPDAVPGGSASVDDKGLTLKYPAELFNESNPLNQQVQENMRRLGGGAAPATSAAPIGGARKPSPFDIDQLDFSASDLAGLTPEIMANALNMGLNLRKTLVAERAAAEAAPLNIRLKESQIAESEARIRQMGKPGKPPAVPTSIQEYRLAQKEGFEGTFREFSETKTTHEKDYLAAIEGGYEGTFHEWYVHVARASVTPLTTEQKVVEKIELEKVAGQSYFADPKKRGRDLDKYIASDEFQNKLFDDNPANVAQYISDAKVTWLEQKISEGGGTIVKRELSANGKIAYWTVEWEVGDPTEVKHVLRK